MRANSRTTLLILCTCMALQMTSFVILLPLFPRRFEELGAGVEALGLSAAAYALASTLAAPFMGALADRLGRRPLVLVSLAAYVAAFCGYLFAQSAAAFIVIRGLAGAFTAGLTPAATGLAADLAHPDRRAQWIGFMSAGASVGWIAGPILGGMLYDRWGYRGALIVSILLAVLALLTAFFGLSGKALQPGHSLPNPEQKTAGGQEVASKGFLGGLRNTLPSSLTPFFLLLFMIFAVLFAWAFIEPRFMFHAYNDLRWSASMLGLVMSTYGAAMLFGVLALGRASNWLGRKPVILLGLALFSAQFIGLAFSRSYVLIAAAFIIAGLGNALYDPVLSASILDISPLRHRSRILGIKSMVGSAGSILGSALIALTSSAVAGRSIFLIALGVVVLAVLAGMTLPGSLRNPKKAANRAAGAGNNAAGAYLNVES